MAVQRLETAEVAYEATLSSYELGVRREAELTHIYGDEAATIGYMTPKEQASVLGELSLRYAASDYAPEETTDVTSFSMWHSYLRGASVENLSVETGLNATNIRWRFHALREQLRELNVPFAELAQQAGSPLIPTISLAEYKGMTGIIYRGPAHDTSDEGPACLQYDPELFFPKKGDSQQGKVAKKICESCMQRDDCLEEALESGHEYGIWGGKTEFERRKLRRRTRAY
jgi:WhiB family redox-sensing transcriptional regulator